MRSSGGLPVTEGHEEGIPRGGLEGLLGQVVQGVDCPAYLCQVAAAAGAATIATEQPAAPAPPQAADSAAPTVAAARPAGAAPKSTAATAQQPYTALVATSEPSSPGTVALEQPPVAPTAASAPSGGSSNAWLIAGIAVLALLIAAGVGLALWRREHR